MKFGRMLRDTAESIPDMQTLFCAYKELKKHLKKIPDREALANLASIQV